MSDVQLTFIVEPIESVITVQPNDITISLTETLLTVYSGSSAIPGGTNGQLQFNYNGTLDGVPDSNYFSGNLTLGNSSNIKITGGNNGYFLQTDGTGNLVWAAGTGNVSGNASAAGANTSIQISDGTGNFVAASGFLFNSGSNVLSAPGNGAFTGNVSASYFIGNGSQLTGIQLPSLISNGTSNVNIPVSSGPVRISANGVANVVVINNGSANLTGNLSVTGGSITGNGSGLSALNASNVSTGTLAQARLANSSVTLGSTALTLGSTVTTVAGLTSVSSTTFVGALTGNASGSAATVTTNAQPNITSVGTLTTLGVNGTVTAIAFTANTGVFTGNGNGLSSLVGANVTGTVANATYAVSAGSTANVLITTDYVAIGNLAGHANLTVSIGNSAGRTGQKDGSIAIGSLAGNANLGLDSIAFGNRAGNGGALGLGNYSIAIGSRAGNVSSSIESVAIGRSAQAASQGVSIGANAGISSPPGGYSIAIGANAMSNRSSTSAIVIGGFAGETSNATANGNYAIAMGFAAAQYRQNEYAISIGTAAGSNAQGNYSIAIGAYTATNTQGQYSIAIGGNTCGNGSLPQTNNSIILNATGNSFNVANANAFYVKPIRNVSAGNIIFYDVTTGEVSYSSTGNIVGTYVTSTPLTYAGLASPGAIGARAFITNANTTTFNDIVGGGGTNAVPIFSDGTNWRIG